MQVELAFTSGDDNGERWGYSCRVDSCILQGEFGILFESFSEWKKMKRMIRVSP